MRAAETETRKLWPHFG